MKCFSFKGTVPGLLFHCCLAPGPGRLVGTGKGGRRWLEEAGSTGKVEKDLPVEERWGACGEWWLSEGGGETCKWLWEQQAEAGEGNRRALIKHQRLLLPPPFYNIYGIYTKTSRPAKVGQFLAKHFLGLAQLVIQTTYLMTNHE